MVQPHRCLDRQPWQCDQILAKIGHFSKILKGFGNYFEGLFCIPMAEFWTYVGQKVTFGQISLVVNGQILKKCPTIGSHYRQPCVAFLHLFLFFVDALVKYFDILNALPKKRWALFVQTFFSDSLESGSQAENKLS